MRELPSIPTGKGWLTRNVLALGLVSLLTDASSEMILPLLPAFLVTLPGGGALALGVIEGAADTIASLLKLVSGRVADRTGRHKPLILAGYGLSSLVRPLVALALAPWHVLAVRCTDRVGKGLRTSPRDALIAGSASSEKHGKAFGFHRAMDHTGAMLGPLLAVGVLAWVTTDLRVVFALAAVPGALAVAAIVFLVRDQQRQAGPAKKILLAPSRSLLAVLVPVGVFTLGAASDTFLLLRLGLEKEDVIALPLLWVALHLVRSVLSTPGGMLADRIGHRASLTLGWLVFAGVFAGMALTESREAAIALFLVFGLYNALAEAPQKALVARFAARTEQGTSFGWYNLTVGLMALPANLMFGALWQQWGAPAAFATGAALALAAVVLLLLLSPLARVAPANSNGG